MSLDEDLQKTKVALARAGAIARALLYEDNKGIDSLIEALSQHTIYKAFEMMYTEKLSTTNPEEFAQNVEAQLPRLAQSANLLDTIHLIYLYASRKVTDSAVIRRGEQASTIESGLRKIFYPRTLK